MAKKTMYGVGEITVSQNYVALNNVPLNELIAKEICPDMPSEQFTQFRKFAGKITVTLEYETAGFWCAEDEEVQG